MKEDLESLLSCIKDSRSEKVAETTKKIQTFFLTKINDKIEEGESIRKFIE